MSGGIETTDYEDVSLLERAIAWTPLECLDDLEEEIVVAFHNAEDEDDEDEVRQACAEVLKYGDRVRLLPRGQLLLIMAATEKEGDYTSMHDKLSEAKVYLDRLVSLVNSGLMDYDPRINKLSESVQEALQVVEEADPSLAPRDEQV